MAGRSVLGSKSVTSRTATAWSEPATDLTTVVRSDVGTGPDRLDKTCAYAAVPTVSTTHQGASASDAMMKCLDDRSVPPFQNAISEAHRNADVVNQSIDCNSRPES